MVIFALAFLLLLGLNTNILAQDEIWMQINMVKEVYSHGEYYGIEFEISGDTMKNVKRVLIKVPNGKRMPLKNVLGLNEVDLNAWGMSYEEFKNRFPEGEYSIVLFPRQYGSMKVNMTHDFPPTPVITYPADGATNVPLDLTIMWEALSGIVSLNLDIEAAVEGKPTLENFGIDDLPVDATSFILPSSLLKPNTQYMLSLCSGANTSLCSARNIYFTTGAE